MGRFPNIGLHHLRSAVAASEFGSFRRAAEFLEMRHSVLSRSISQFEHSVGVTIFERSASGVAPTAAGRSILRMSRVILEQIDDLVVAGKANGDGNAGRLSVGFCSSISAGNLRASLMELRKRAPRLELAVVERSRLRLINAVRNGAVDVVVVPGGRIPPDQKGLPIWSERILLLLSENHSLASQAVVYWTDLRNQTLLLSRHDPGDDIEELLFSKLVAKAERPKVERHDVSRSIVKSLVSMGVGVSLIMESDVGAMLPGLVYRELRDGTGPSRIDFHAIWRTENENVALRRFLEVLEERYPTPPSPPLVE